MTTNPIYGQFILGPPGSGKTTYVQHISTVLRESGRQVIIVNLDSGNILIEKNDPNIIDVRDLISVDESQILCKLGPNGATIFCFEFLEEKLDWLIEKMKTYGSDAYFMFDMPGQVELITHHTSIHRILQRLRKEFDIRLTAVHLVDAIHVIDPTRFISVVLVSLISMMRLALPQINVLSKIDLLNEEDLIFPLDFYTHLSSIKELEPYIMSNTTTTTSSQSFTNTSRSHKLFLKKKEKLYQVLCDVIDEYGQVSYETLSVYDQESIARLLQLIDKSVGYVPLKKNE
jgi:GTPase SAR1 family protein